MSKKTVTKKVPKVPTEKVTLKKELIDLLRPFFNLGYPALKVEQRTTDINGNSVKMPSRKTIAKYYTVWKAEHTIAMRENLAIHQREIKAQLIDNYEEIIVRAYQYYIELQEYFNKKKNNSEEKSEGWFAAMIKQLTDHNTLIGELLAAKARLEMTPFIDQTSEDAVKKKLEHDIEQQHLKFKENEKEKSAQMPKEATITHRYEKRMEGSEK